MAGDFGAPYRAPCGGWPQARIWFLGGAFQHRRDSEAHLQRYHNATAVPDYHVPPGADLEPYPRFDSRVNWPDTGTCPGPGEQPNSTCGQNQAGFPKCGPWYDHGQIDDRPAGTPDHNSYALQNGVFIDRSDCHKLGFKNVQARKFWHGRFGFLSHDPAGRPDRRQGPEGSGCGCSLEFEQGQPDGTKYRRAALECITHSKYFYGGEWVYDYTATANRAATVGRYTGVITQTACGVTGDESEQSVAEAKLIDHIGISAAKAIDWYESYLEAWTGLGWTILETLSGGVYAVTATDENQVTRGDGSLNCATGAMTIHQYAASAGLILTETATFSNTAFSHSFVQTSEPVGQGDYYETNWTVTGTLSDAYTSDDLVADAVGLLGQWDLTDDVVYPWRHDELCSIAPLVGYNEVRGAINPETGLQTCNWTDPNAGGWDGSVEGTPLAAGRGPHFDWEHKTWRVCKDPNGNKAYYIYAYGEWAGGRSPTGVDYALNDWTDRVVPETATRWTWNYGDVPIAGNVPGYAWMIYEPAAGALVAQKWAEIKVLRPSYNFARPCCGDRFALDETDVGCAQDLGGNVVAVNPDLPAPGQGDRYLVDGLGSLDGVWSVTKQSAQHFHLDSRVSPALSPFVPSVDVAIFGRLRWPGAPGICGRAALTGATNANPIAITVATPVAWWTGDQVVITGATGNTAANGTHTITVIDSTHATLDVAGNGDYTGGGYGSYPGAAGYQWNDDQCKGDYYAVEWEFNNRDWAERQRVIAQANNSQCASCPDLQPENSSPIRPLQGGRGMPRDVSALNVTEACLPFAVCCPQVIAISPNSETWTNGTTYPFGAFAADERYGARWQMAVVQQMADPLWQAPHKPCVQGQSEPQPTGCTWVEDNAGCAGCGHNQPGLCNEDTCDEGPPATGARFYPQRPWVEARASVPSGAPDLPTGPSLHVLDTTELNETNLPPGLVLPPPVGLGYMDQDNGADPCQPVPAVTPWGIYLRELSCVCGAGRFAAEYQANGVLC